MSVEIAIRKYLDVIRSDIFAKYEKEFARRISSELAKGYLQNLPEPPLVQIVGNVVKGVHDLTERDDRTCFELSTKSIFIHGNKSQVEFDYYGQSSQRELGDLIFIISVVFNGQKYFEKFTINQFKKEKQTKRAVSWDISNKEQLHLLSKFPSFRGIKGSIIPTKEFNLPNYSGCLGSYGLLYRPGDFAFTSATRLDSYLGYSKKISGNDLFLLGESREAIDMIGRRRIWHEWIHIMEFCRHFCEPKFGICFCLCPFSVFMGNYHFARNIFDFVDKYLRLCIGEPTNMEIGRKNINARNFLYELLSAIRIKVDGKGSDDTLSFIDGFFKYGFSDNEGKGNSGKGIESDFEGGEIGIIHTVINLGE